MYICFKTEFTDAINDWIHIIFVPIWSEWFTKLNGKTKLHIFWRYMLFIQIPSIVYVNSPHNMYKNLSKSQYSSYTVQIHMLFYYCFSKRCLDATKSDRNLLSSFMNIKFLTDIVFKYQHLTIWIASSIFPFIELLWIFKILQTNSS
jgi:hypothetical protein